VIHFGLLILTIISIEILNFSNIKFLITQSITLYKKIFKLLISNNVSDSHKEKVLLNYSRNILIISIKILLILIMISILFFIVGFYQRDFLDLVISIWGILEMLIICFMYIFIKRLFYAKL
jgi:hypothetical protein